MNGIGLRESLKFGTTDQHTSVDCLISKLELSSSSGYAAFLSLHAKVLLPIEQWLERHGVEAELPDWSERRRSSALLDDLAQLGIPAPPYACRGHLTLAATPPVRAGVLYVIEGSRLGSTVLARRLDPGGTAFPTSFLLHGRGQDLWPRFVEWLNRQEFDAAGTGIALNAARKVFEIYREAMPATPR